ncbi:MAG TPA: tetraacyldisaccharide 4'-kinase, partial [Longimicrobiales bacterium]|nr:tetraacyldisaccharide 4'-kinase [Longimicrobiales bacterium]
MRIAPERIVRRWWAGEGGLGGGVARTLTAPSEWLYRLGTGLRNRAFDAGWLRTHRTPGPVVSVGNLVVGGTGKTPVSAWLGTALERAGCRPALVARGYGVDELALHRRWNPSIPVH